MGAIAVQLIINGIIAGSIYALVASGFSLVYSVAKFMHMAHGAVLAAGAFFLYTFAVQIGLNFWVAVIATLLATCALGELMNRIVYKKLPR